MRRRGCDPNYPESSTRAKRESLSVATSHRYSRISSRCRFSPLRLNVLSVAESTERGCGWVNTGGARHWAHTLVGRCRSASGRRFAIAWDRMA